jgi:beta-N-acetylhexosaminidase
LCGLASASLVCAGETPPVDVQALSLEEKVGQLLLLAFEGSTARDAEVLLGWHYVGSVYLSQDNLTELDQAAALLTELQRIGAGTPHKLPIFAGCDQEGAWSVLNPRATRGPGNLALGAAPPSQVEAMYTVFGRELQALGVAGDLAPVADVNANPRNPIIGTRSFGQDPQRVAAAVAAAVRGLHAGGSRACAKHFPGHGDTAQDSHRELAIVSRSREQIRNGDLVPFRAAIEAGVDMVMTAHLRYPAFDTEWPATLSPAILEGLLRKELGFKGVILTDSFSMGAIRRVYGTAEAAVRAINAGADLVMLAEERYGDETSGYLTRQVALIEEIRRAVRDGKIPMARVDEAVGRVLELKAAAHLFTRPYPDRGEAQRVVGSKANQDVALESARAAVLVARNLDRRVPVAVRSDRKIILVSPIGQEAYAGLRRMRGIGPNISEPPTEVLFREIKRRYPAAEMVRIAQAAGAGAQLDRLRAAGTVIVATENYPLPGFDFPTAPQRAVVEALIAAGIQPVVVGLRDPYELMDLANVRTYIAALGYAPVCAQAAAEVLFGERRPAGRMPVNV